MRLRGRGQPMAKPVEPARVGPLYHHCGGCGATDPIQRCIGCLHPFEYTYAERRAKALALAAAHDGWGIPPRPEGQPHIWPPRYIPHKLAVRLFGRGGAPLPDRYGHCLVNSDFPIQHYFRNKELRQNREKLDA